MKLSDLWEVPVKFAVSLIVLLLVIAMIPTIQRSTNAKPYPTLAQVIAWAIIAVVFLICLLAVANVVNITQLSQNFTSTRV